MPDLTELNGLSYKEGDLRRQAIRVCADSSLPPRREIFQPRSFTIAAGGTAPAVPKGGAMVSIWFLFWAFLVGGFAGMLVFALTTMASREDDRTTKAEKRVKRYGLDGVELDNEWIDSDRWSARFG